MANLRSTLGVNEFSDKKAGLLRALLAEFIGTLLLNFFGCGSVITGNVVAISLSFGLTVAGVVQAIGHVSGGHINPAVTVGLAAIGKVSIVRAILYILVQCLGAISGSAILRALSTEKAALGVVEVAKDLTPVQGMGVEAFLDFILVLVVCGACDAGKPDSKGVAPLIIGLAVTVGHIVGVPRTGAGMNPARSLGSSVVMGAYENHWVYWVGPLLGGVLASLIYTYIIGPAKHQESAKTYATVATDDKELQRLNTRKNNPA